LSARIRPDSGRNVGYQTKIEEVRVVRSFAPAIALFALMAPPLAHAQVNIDQDKTPAHIYASDCAVCHKTIRGLANGRGNAALTGFLNEHYTSNEQEAAALAAYVLAGGGGSGTPAPVRVDNSDADQSAAEPKPREARRPAKPGQGPAASAKPPRSAERSKPEKPERSASVELGRAERKPLAGRRDGGAPDRLHGRIKPAEAAPIKPQPAKPEPAQLAAAPKPAEVAKPDGNPPPSRVVAPEQTRPAGAAPAPTDNIPD
jgi:hypothetical protein